MKIKRFHARTMRAALQQVREEQGPESVILSKRRVEGGMEVIAAVDYDEALLHQWTQQHATSRPAGGPMGGEGTEPCPALHPGASAYASTAMSEAAPEGPPSVGSVPAPEPEQDAGAPPASAAPEPSGSTDFRAIFDAAAAISPLPEPTRDAESLEAISARIDRLRDTVSRQLDELRWDDLKRREPKLAEVIRRLDLLDLERPQVRAIVRALDARDDQKKLWRSAIAMLAKRIPLVTADICDEGGIFAVVGPTGAGKTTSVAKLATRFALSHGSGQLGLITTDSHRIGAQDHLFRFGKILGVPVQVATSPDILRATLDQLADRQLILIDTAGFSPRDEAMFANLQQLTGHAPAVQTLLALPANAQTASLKENIRIFDRRGLDGAIVTKVDEATSLGGLLSAVMEADLNVCYVSNGQRVPEDIRPASRYRAGFVSEAVSLARRFSVDCDKEDKAFEESTPQTLPPLTTTEKRIASYG